MTDASAIRDQAPRAEAPRAVIFDLDGTLVDAFEDIRHALNHTRARAGLPLFSLAEVMPLVGHGLRRLVEDALPPGIARAELDGHIEAALAYYSGHLVDHTRPYPGVAEMLAGLRARGLRLAVLSNKPDELTRGILGALGLAPSFDAIAGLAPGAPRKPDPESLAPMLRALGVEGRQAVVVGDGETDMEVGRAVGARVAACLYGARSREQLAPWSPDAWLARPDDLIPWIDTLPGRPR